MQKVDPKVKKLQAVVLLPTRELAIQVAEELRRFAKFMHGIKVLPVYGGQDIVRQIRALKDGTQIVVGTPGRVMDHMRRKTVKMDHVHTVVLDEADEMLNMGFLEDMETILSQLPEETPDTDVLRNHASGHCRHCKEIPERPGNRPCDQKGADCAESDPVLL